MTAPSYQICYNPIVNRAAWAVLLGIVPQGIDPRYMGEWVETAQEAAPGYTVEVVNANTGFGDDAHGLGWHRRSEEGTVWLLVPGYRDVGEPTGWTGPPQVILDGEGTLTDAVMILEGMARQLGVKP